MLTWATMDFPLLLPFTIRINHIKQPRAHSSRNFSTMVAVTTLGSWHPLDCAEQYYHEAWRNNAEL